MIQCIHCEEMTAATRSEQTCEFCGERVGQSQCHECGEWKDDPGDFYDGLRCTVCCEEGDE